MKTGGKARSAPPRQEGGGPLCRATYYAVISAAILIGLVAYRAGATFEGALVRVLVTLLAGTVLGYLLNLFLWLTGQEQAAGGQTGTAPAAAGGGSRVVADGRPPAGHAIPSTPRIDLTVGDPEPDAAPVRS